ncbi:MAG: hypothetical protein M3Q37_08420, partial [Gemmatimonadota bacterium]|nr:hypothetical protein [Gemmatimonadota bacterium]
MHGSRSGRWSRSRPSAKRHSIVALFTLLSVLALAGSAHAADPTIAAVGDLGCATTDPSYNGGDGTATHCRQRYVSDLLVDQGLVGFLGLGDNQYVNGERANFQAVYDGTFGRVNPIAYPSLGNAQYYTPGAKGYFDYFASAGVTTRIGASSLDASRFASSNYYSYEIGGWHLIALNSNCAQVGGCGVGSPQEAWLKRDLALYPNRCTLAYWHHPRWNSGRLGNDSSTAALWTALYDARADIVLNGHGNHHYERHAPMDASGAPDAANGIREFIVSTGGEAHGVPPTTAGKTDTLQVADYTSFGILKVGLHARSYDWQFVPEVGGSFTDSGSGTCHA